MSLLYALRNAIMKIAKTSYQERCISVQTTIIKMPKEDAL